MFFTKTDSDFDIRPALTPPKIELQKWYSDDIIMSADRKIIIDRPEQRGSDLKKFASRRFLEIWKYCNI